VGWVRILMFNKAVGLPHDDSHGVNRDFPPSKSPKTSKHHEPETTIRAYQVIGCPRVFPSTAGEGAAFFQPPLRFAEDPLRGQRFKSVYKTSLQVGKTLTRKGILLYLRTGLVTADHHGDLKGPSFAWRLTKSLIFALVHCHALYTSFSYKTT